MFGLGMAYRRYMKIWECGRAFPTNRRAIQAMKVSRENGENQQVILTIEASAEEWDKANVLPQ